MEGDKFCKACGKKLTHVKARGYNTQTGKPNTWASCPTHECGHTGHFHDYEKVSMFSAKNTCTKCGNSYYSD